MQATHFIDVDVTLIVASIDHVVADVQSFMDFMAAWCNRCAAAARAQHAAAVVAEVVSAEQGAEEKSDVRLGIHPKAAPQPPQPLFDRGQLLPAAVASPSVDAGVCNGADESNSWRRVWAARPPFEVGFSE